ncbi:MAG: hypothetical protein ABSC29_01670 [Minisyncoccia bacterium]|jgi:hypothetical protein
MELKIETFEYAPGALVEYVVQAAVIVYCGIADIRELPQGASTTNSAFDIMKGIAKAIGKPMNALTFFELATHTSWILQVGEYDFQSVKLSYGLRKESPVYSRTQAPKAILHAFRHRIGGDAIRKYEPDPEEMIDESVIEA